MNQPEKWMNFPRTAVPELKTPCLAEDVRRILERKVLELKRVLWASYIVEVYLKKWRLEVGRSRRHALAAARMRLAIATLGRI